MLWVGGWQGGWSPVYLGIPFIPPSSPSLLTLSLTHQALPSTEGWQTEEGPSGPWDGGKTHGGSLGNWMVGGLGIQSGDKGGSWIYFSALEQTGLGLNLAFASVPSSIKCVFRYF